MKPLTGDGSVLKMHGAIGLPALVGRRRRSSAVCARTPTPSGHRRRRSPQPSNDGDIGHARHRHDHQLPRPRTAQPPAPDRRSPTRPTSPARWPPSTATRSIWPAASCEAISGAAFGGSAVDFVSRFSVNHARDQHRRRRRGTGVMDYDLEEAEFARDGADARRALASSSPTTPSSAGRGWSQVCGFDGFGEIVTDRLPPRDVGHAIDEAGAKLISSQACRSLPAFQVFAGPVSIPADGVHPQAVAVLRGRGRAGPGLGAAHRTFRSRNPRSPRRCKELEGDLGVELFDRHPRGLTITHKGHQFLRHATKILADVSDARRTFFRRPGADRRKRLQLGVTSLVAGYVLSDLLARYRRGFPGVEIRRDRGQWRLSRAPAGRRRSSTSR